MRSQGPSPRTRSNSYGNTVHHDRRPTDDDFGISRRRVLPSTALTTGVFGLGLPLSTTGVLALDYSGSIGSALWSDIESGAESFPSNRGGGSRAR
ncbi:hypothetical protein [Haloarchaeobius iranensis]|uniref:hypothetical protein n=1 Tax=Haloarchaeobius iranensis TaxID=996166 RepID=UPI00111424B6